MNKYNAEIFHNACGYQTIFRIWNGVEYRVNSAKGVRTYKTEKMALKMKAIYETTGN